MKRFLFTFLILILPISVSYAQNSLIIKYHGNGIIGEAGVLPSQAPEIKQKIIRLLNEDFLPVVVEYKKNLKGKYTPYIVWIYLSDTEIHPDVSKIQSDYHGKIDLVCIKLSPKLRLKLNDGIEKFFKHIGVQYQTNEFGEVISIVDYEKLQRFI